MMCCNARRKIQAEGRAAGLKVENARLQERVEELDADSCSRRACVHTAVRADEAEAHMVDAWLEYRRLWLRWFEEGVEKRYKGQLVRETRRDRDRYKVLAERFATSLHYKDVHGLLFKDCLYRICQEARDVIAMMSEDLQ